MSDKVLAGCYWSYESGRSVVRGSMELVNPASSGETTARIASEIIVCVGGGQSGGV